MYFPVFPEVLPLCFISQTVPLPHIRQFVLGDGRIFVSV